ncbi:MAG: hypothetical protein AVDCRST_MAG40-2607, partial [uncultured Gemmatimonadaceae bacterium]
GHPPRAAPPNASPRRLVAGRAARGGLPRRLRRVVGSGSPSGRRARAAAGAAPARARDRAARRDAEHPQRRPRHGRGARFLRFVVEGWRAPPAGAVQRPGALDAADVERDGLGGRPRAARRPDLLRALGVLQRAELGLRRARPHGLPLGQLPRAGRRLTGERVLRAELDAPQAALPVVHREHPARQRYRRASHRARRQPRRGARAARRRVSSQAL